MEGVPDDLGWRKAKTPVMGRLLERPWYLTSGP